MSLVLALALLVQQPPPAEGAGKPAEVAIQAPADELKALRENNIFSPKKPKKDGPVKPTNQGNTTKEPDKTSSAPKPDPIIVTGLYLNETGQYEAVIEDKKKKEIRWCKAGDTYEGWTIVSVSLTEMVAKKGTEEKKLKAGEPLIGELPPPPIDPKVLLGEAETDPKKLEEARSRMKERMKEKKGAVEDVVEDAPVQKKTPKP